MFGYFLLVKEAPVAAYITILQSVYFDISQDWVRICVAWEVERSAYAPDIVWTIPTYSEFAVDKCFSKDFIASQQQEKALPNNPGTISL